MEIWVLGLGVLAIVAVLLYASHGDNKWRERVDREMKEIQSLVRKLHNPTALESAYQTKIDGVYSVMEKYQDGQRRLGAALDELLKRNEVLEIRQRTLEKKIIEANRTVNLVFGKPIPVQMESIPHIINKQKRTTGKGRGALIPETAI